MDLRFVHLLANRSIVGQTAWAAARLATTLTVLGFLAKAMVRSAEEATQ